MRTGARPERQGGLLAQNRLPRGVEQGIVRFASMRSARDLRVWQPRACSTVLRVAWNDGFLRGFD